MSLVRFHQIEKDDLEMLKDWRNDPSVRLICREYRLLNDSLQEYWHDSTVHDTDFMMFKVEALKSNGNKRPGELTEQSEPKYIGVCGWTFIDWRSRHALLSLYIGEPDYRTDDYYAAIFHELHRVAFKELDMHVVRAEIYAFDPRLEMFYSAGYEKTGVRREQYYHDGKHHDIYVMDILKRDWIKANG